MTACTDVCGQDEKRLNSIPVFRWTRNAFNFLLMSYPLLEPEVFSRPRAEAEFSETNDGTSNLEWQSHCRKRYDSHDGGNVYFPESSLKREYFLSSSTTSLDPVRGQARYMSLLINGQDNPDAAWYYPDPSPVARKVKGYVAFWRGVEVEK